MKETLVNHHLPSFLEQLNKELQMAIDYIKALMNKDNSSDSSVNQIKSKSELAKSIKSDILGTNSSVIGNFVDEPCQKYPEAISKMSANEFYDEPNYYYGGKLFSKGLLISRALVNSYKHSNIEADTLLFDSFDKMDFFKTKFSSQNKVGLLPKNSDKVETLFAVKRDTQVRRVQKLDVPTPEKKKNKLTSLKQENIVQTNIISTTPNATQEQIKDKRKLNLNAKLQTKYKCDVVNDTALDNNYVSKQTQTHVVYMETASQTTKTVPSRCDAGMNTNFDHKYINTSSTPVQACDDEKKNNKLLKHLDTGLQTSVILAPKPEKPSQKPHKRRKLAKRNEKLRLMKVIDTPIDEYYKNDLFPYAQEFYDKKRQRRKEFRFVPQNELYKLYNNKKYDKSLKKTIKVKTYPRYVNNCTDEVLVFPNDILIDTDRYNRNQFYKPLRRYLEKSTPYKKPYDYEFVKDNNDIYVEHGKQDHKRKYKTRNNHECVNVEGVNIEASRKLTLLDILNVF